MEVRNAPDVLPPGQTWQVYGVREGERGDDRPALVDFLLSAGEVRVAAASFNPTLARQLGEHLIEMAEEAERPLVCCGKCPPIKGGGIDCTCDGNPRCQGPR